MLLPSVVHIEANQSEPPEAFDKFFNTWLVILPAANLEI